MSKPVHTVEVLDGSTQQRLDRITMGMLVDLTLPAITTSDVSVLVAVAIKGLPANYVAIPSCNKALALSITGKTAEGFNIVGTPLVAGSALTTSQVSVLVAG